MKQITGRMKQITFSFVLVAVLSLSNITQMTFAASSENQVMYDFQDPGAEAAAGEAAHEELTDEEFFAGEAVDEELTDEEAAEGEAADEELADGEAFAEKAVDEELTDEEAAAGEMPDEEVTGDGTTGGEAAYIDVTGEEAAVAEAADSDSGAEDEDDRQLPDNGIPVVIIEIDESDGHTIDDMNSSSDHSVDCYGTMQIIVPGGFMYCDMAKAPSSLRPVQLEYIRGRGNSTWTFEKKPYRIKLSKKVNILELGKNKHWVLLANTLDPTGFKNRFTGVLGDALGFEFTPNGLPVDVVMVAKRDGEEYARINLGNYLLAEQVRVDDNRLEIRELSADDTAPEDITGGYLIHFGSQVAEDDPDKFYTDRGIDLANDLPTFNPDDSDYTNEVQKEYIRDYIQKMENALFGEGVDDGDPFADQDGIRYNEYMDMESAALFWLIQEVSNNTDKYTTGSNYFYKTEDKFDDSGNLSETGRIFWGPLWDMDQGWSIPGMPDMNIEGFHLINEWLTAMVYDDNEEGFRETAKRLWPAVRDEILTLLEERGLVDKYFAETELSCVRDYEIWGDRIPGYREGGDFSENKENFKSWTRARIEWMDAHILGEGGDEYPNIDNAACRVTYIADERIIRREYYQKGGFCKLYSPDGDNEDVFIPQKEGYVFLGWEGEDGRILTSGEDMDADRTFYAAFVKEGETIKAEKILFRSEAEGCSLDREFFTSHYTILPYDAQDKEVVWTSSDPDIAAVDENGKVELLGTGTVMITATLSSGAAGSYQLTIFDEPQPEPESLDPDSDQIVLKPGEYGHVDYRILPGYPSAYEVSFRPEDSSIATVDGNGVVTALQPGSTRIIIEAKYYDTDDNERSIEGSYIVTVTDTNTNTEEATITYILAGGSYDGSTADIVETHNIGDIISIREAPSREGYTFNYWMGSEYYPGDSYKVSGDHTFTAVWTENDEGGDGDGTPADEGDTSADEGDTPAEEDDTPGDEGSGKSDVPEDKPVSGDDGDDTPADEDDTSADEGGGKSGEPGDIPVSVDDGDDMHTPADGDDTPADEDDSKNTSDKNHDSSQKSQVSSTKTIVKSKTIVKRNTSSKSPSTGDESEAVEWLALMLIAGAGALFIALSGRKHRSRSGD